jgi:hypothetical protein
MWAAIGCGMAFAVVSFIAPAVPLVALVTVVLLVWRRDDLRPALGVVSGMGVMLLIVAYLQRKGPGTVYWHTTTAGGSDTYLDPRPWLVVGVALVVGGTLTFILMGRRAHRPDRPASSD